jgi:hypothetical protein
MPDDKEDLNFIDTMCLIMFERGRTPEQIVASWPGSEAPPLDDVKASIVRQSKVKYPLDQRQ